MLCRKFNQFGTKTKKEHFAALASDRIQKRLINPKFSNYFYVKYANYKIKNEKLLEKLNK